MQNFLESFINIPPFSNFMGRIKTKLIKRLTVSLLKLHADIFTKDFNENKPLVSKHLENYSKKLRNVVAGYVTRLKRAEKY